MLRIAAAEDLTALTRLRRAATGDSAEDAAGWLQRVAGLENILLLEKPGAPPALMLAAVPVHYAHRKGIWFTGLAADKGVPADKLLPRLLEGALRAFADQAGLTSLGDWTWREDLTYPRAIYSLNGQALVAAASGAYTVNDYFTYSGATSDRWYVSIELSLCAEANLPLRMQDDTTNLEKEANPDA